MPNGTNPSANSNQLIEEELLKVKMREAETQSEMKSINLKIMQLDTEVINHTSQNIFFSNIV